jgi:hypothetical protein
MAHNNNEIHNYPVDKKILYKTPNHSFEYNIIREGIYPTKLLYTYSRKNCPSYPIPNFYFIETQYGKDKNKKKVQCKINYENSKPIFTILFEDLNKVLKSVTSNKSASDATEKYLKVIIYIKSFLYILFFINFFYI